MWSQCLRDDLVAAGLVAVLVALIVPRIIGTSASHFSPVHSELSAFKSMLDHFHLDCGRYPTTKEGLEALHTAPPSVKDRWGPQSYTDKETFDDPWGNPYLYRSDGQNHFTLRSYGQDGQAGGEGYDADVEPEP